MTNKQNNYRAKEIEEILEHYVYLTTENCDNFHPNNNCSCEEEANADIEIIRTHMKINENLVDTYHDDVLYLTKVVEGKEYLKEQVKLLSDRVDELVEEKRIDVLPNLREIKVLEERIDGLAEVAMRTDKHDDRMDKLRDRIIDLEILVGKLTAGVVDLQRKGGTK